MGDINWPGLLKWSLQYTDGTNSENVKARSKEDLEFLEKAIKLALGSLPDYYKICVEAIDKLSEGKPEEVLAALGIIQECLDLEPDLARNLVKYPDAFKRLLNCIENSDPMSVEQAALVLSFALPNNPQLQCMAWNLGAGEIILNKLKLLASSVLSLNPSTDEVRLFSRLYSCLGGLVKNESQNEKHFISHTDGVQLSINVLSQSREPSVITKVASLIQHLIASGNFESKVTPRLVEAVNATVKNLTSSGEKS